MNRNQPLKQDPEKVRAFQERGRESSARSLGASGRTAAKKSKPAPVSPASKAQREKVRAMGFCIGCGAHLSDYVAIDPAHVVDRSLGGCDHPDCVVPLCRTFGGGCHRLFDEGGLDLLPYLEPGFRVEQAHAVKHLGIAGALRRITNDRKAAA